MRVRTVSLPALDAPSHTGTFQSLRDEYFVCGFDNTGSDGEAPVADVPVVHALTVLAEEGEFALDGVVPACCFVAEVA